MDKEEWETEKTKEYKEEEIVVGGKDAAEGERHKKRMTGKEENGKE